MLRETCRARPFTKVGAVHVASRPGGSGECISRRAGSVGVVGAAGRGLDQDHLLARRLAAAVGCTSTWAQRRSLVSTQTVTPNLKS